MKSIPLTQGLVALVDDADLDWLNQWKWCAAKAGSGGGMYAQRNAKIGGTWKRIKMHHVILGVNRVDHRNGDGLDNQRHNLRPATQAQNAKNQRKRASSTSPFKGVTFHKKGRKWMAQIMCDYKRVYLGLFDRAADAARAYDEMATTLHGEFASLNFPVR